MEFDCMSFTHVDVCRFYRWGPGQDSIYYYFKCVILGYNIPGDNMMCLRLL